MPRFLRRNVLIREKREVDREERAATCVRVLPIAVYPSTTFAVHPDLFPKRTG